MYDQSQTSHHLRALATRAVSIVLDNQGIDTVSVPIDPLGKSPRIFALKPVDLKLINKIRETSKDFLSKADATLKRLNYILPSESLLSLDRSVLQVSSVFNFHNNIRTKFGEQAFNAFLEKARAQSAWITNQQIEDIVNGNNNDLKARLILNKNIQPDKRRPLGLKLLNSLGLELKLAIAKDPNTDKDWLDLLAHDSASRVQQAVAKNENTRFSTLSWMARETDVAVLCCIALNGQTDKSTLHDLAHHFSEEVRATVALNPNITAKTIQKLLNDKSLVVLEALASNHRLSAPTMMTLFSKDIQAIDVALAGNGQAPETLLLALAEKPNWSIRFALSNNPATSNQALNMVLEAFETLKAMDIQGVNPNEAYLALRAILQITSRTSLSADMLQRIYLMEAPPWDFSHEWLDRILFLAKNPTTPAFVLRDIMQNANEHVQEALMENPNLPDNIRSQIPDIYQKLSQILASADEQRIGDILFDYEIPKDAHQRLPNLYQTLLDTHLWENDITLASSVDVPAFVLNQLANKQDWHIWIALAANSSFPDEHIAPLMEAVNDSPLTSVLELELATELVKHRKIPLDCLARWSFKSHELDEAISADARWQKLVSRMLDLSTINQDWAQGQRPTKKLRQC